MRRRFLVGSVFTVLALLGPLAGAASAQTPDLADAVGAVTSAANEMWVIIAGVLVMFMQAGFALVEAGFTRAKNAANIIMKNMMDFAIGGIVYWAVGFAIMFGAGNAFFGTSGFFLHDAGDTFASLDSASTASKCW